LFGNRLLHLASENRTAKHKQESNMQTPASSPSRGARGRLPAKLFTIDEAAELLNVSPRTVRRLVASGALPVHRLGRLVRIADIDIAAFLAANRSL
jgi:excisionase family DNA binding protein